MILARVVFFSAVLSFAPATPALALPADLDAPEVERGARGWALDIDRVRSSDAEGFQTASAAGFSFAPIDWAALTVEAGVADPSEAAPAVEAAKIEALLVPAGQDGPWTFGAKLGLSGGLEQGVNETAEVVLIAQRPIGVLQALANLGFARDFGPEAVSEVTADYALRLEGPVGAGVLAAEVLGEIDDSAAFGLSDARAHMAGLALGTAFAPLGLEVAAFTGLTDASPETALRLRLALALD